VDGEARLLEDLKHPDWSLRARAAQLLQQSSSPDSLVALVAALDDADTAVISAAAESLIRRDDPSAIEPMWAALNDLREDAIDEIWSEVWHLRETPIGRELARRG
jgi:HEAT repeat protein